MKVSVLLRDTRTGREKWYADPSNYEDENHADFMWTDGNYGCDCNRSTFLGIDKLPCGDGTIELVQLIPVEGS